PKPWLSQYPFHLYRHLVLNRYRVRHVPRRPKARRRIEPPRRSAKTACSNAFLPSPSIGRHSCTDRLVASEIRQTLRVWVLGCVETCAPFCDTKTCDATRRTGPHAYGCQASSRVSTVMRKPGLNLCALSRRFFRDRRGVASIFGVMVILTGFGFSVMVLDIGHLYLEKRRLQSAVDAAALAAAGDPTNASAIV